MVDARLVVKLPNRWPLTDAAGVPVVFLTAYYALRVLAQVQPGESVLVHAAAGGGYGGSATGSAVGIGGFRYCQSRQVGHVADNGM